MKFLKEPFVHFLLIGALLFLAYRFFNPEPAAQPEDIIVSAGKIEQLGATFTRTWQRPPSPEELKGLVDGYVQEEMLSREAVKLSLDQDDPIIRRRLQQKMDFIIGDLSGAFIPDEDTLRQYLSENPDQFRSPSTYTLQHVYLNPDRRQAALATDATVLLSQLRSEQGDFRELGDTTMLPAQFDATTAPRIDATFGDGFHEILDTLPVGEWSGPVDSGYGIHLIRLVERTPGEIPAFEQIRSVVEREWANQRNRETREQYLNMLLEQYNVSIEWPTDAVRQ